MLWVLVPVKELSRSKQRLAGVLPRDEREGLMLAMLQDVLTAIRGVPKIDGVLLVSRSQKARVLAGDFVTDIFAESPGSDHSRAVTEANRYLIERHQAQSSLAISSDIPRVTAKDIQQIIAHHDRVTLVPNASGEGTNVIMATPPNAFTCQFGGRSLRRHRASAEAAGLSPFVVHNQNLAHDIDDVSDLVRAVTALPASVTRDYLQDSGIAERLRYRIVSESKKPLQMSSVANQCT